MATTSHLGLTLVEQAQAQKEVTVNQAFTRLDALLNTGAIDKDLATPPGSPATGDVYIVAGSPTGAWSGHATHIAYFDQIWRFVTPREGMLLWVNDENLLYIFDGTVWSGYPSQLQNLQQLGVNASADSTNKLTVSSSAALLTHAGTDIRLKLNKNSGSDTASLLFQTGYSGRVEFGLMGSDDFTCKTSPDGSSFATAFTVSKTNGNTSFQRQVAFKRVTVTAHYTSAGESLFGVRASSTGITLTLASGDRGDGTIRVIKDEAGNAATHTITITPQSGTIDGAASKTITSNYGVVRLYDDGTNYFTF
jgi:hypothetical protein